MSLFIGLSIVFVFIILTIYFILFFKGGSSKCTFEMEAKQNSKTGEIEVIEKLENISEPVITIGKMLLDEDERIVKETKKNPTDKSIREKIYSVVGVFELVEVSYTDTCCTHIRIKGLKLTSEEYWHLECIFKKLEERVKLKEELRINKEDKDNRKIMIDKLNSVKEEFKNENN